MRADRPLRIPLQLGTSSAASLARAAAFLVPGIILLAAPFAAFIYFFGGAADIPDLGEGAGYILFPFAIPFYFGWKHLWRSVNERASDLVLTADGFQVRGGPASGRRIAWSDLSKVAIEAKSDKGEDSDLSALWATVRGLRGPQRLCLAAAETDEEKASLVELSRTLQAGMGTRAESQGP